MAPEQTKDRNEHALKGSLFLGGLGLCTTWIIYLAATQLRDGNAALSAPATGLVERVLLAPVRSLGLSGSYILLLCLGSLFYALWSRRRIAQLPRRAVGLPLLLLGLSALSALAAGDGRLWGGAFGEILGSSFLVVGKPLAFVVSLAILGFGLVMARDWFYFDELRRLVGGGRAAPAFALGMGGGTGVVQRRAAPRGERDLQIGEEPLDDFDRNLDLAPLPMAAGLTTLEPATDDEDLGPARSETVTVATGSAATRPAEATGAGPFGEDDDFAAADSDPLLTPARPDANKQSEIDAGSGDDDALEDFLAEESREEDEPAETGEGDDLPQLDWSGTVSERSDADLFADLDVNLLAATEVADPVKEPEMFAATEAPVREGPTIGWDDDDDVDWEDEDDDYEDEDEDEEDDDYEDEDEDEDDDEDEDEDDDEDDEEEYEYEEEEDEDEDYEYEEDDDEFDSKRHSFVASTQSEAAPAASSSFELEAEELDELFDEPETAVGAASAVIEEPEPLFPAFDVDENELFELETAEVEDGLTLDSLAEDGELEVQSLLFPVEDSRPAPTDSPAENAATPRTASPRKSKPAPEPGLWDGMGGDWAPWGEDSTPVRPAAMMAADEIDEIEEFAAEIDELRDEESEESAPPAEAIAADDDEAPRPAPATAEAELPELAELEETLAPQERAAAAPAPAAVEIEPAEIEEPLALGELPEDEDEALEFGAMEFGEVDFLDDEVAEPASARPAPQAGPGLEYDRNFGDPLYDAAVKLCLGRDTCRISFLQRNLDIDFARAAALIERMASEGLVGPYSASGQHEILVSLDEWLAGR